MDAKVLLIRRKNIISESIGREDMGGGEGAERRERGGRKKMGAGSDMGGDVGEVQRVKNLKGGI